MPAGAKPGRRGQEPHEITPTKRQLVQVLHANGISHRIIAKNIGCDEKTLRKHYRAELDDAHEQLESAMVAALVKAAQGGAWGAAKYWLATHSKDDRWRTPESHRISGEVGGAPIRIEVSEMSDEDLQREIDEIDSQRRALSEARALVADLPGKSNGVGH